MATLRKFFKVSMIIDHSVLHDLMMLADGNAVKGSLDVQPVKHGGEDNNGRLKAQLSGREFVLAYMQTIPRLVMKDAIAAGAEHGITRAGVYTATNTLAREKVIKRIDVGTYVPTNKAAAKKAAQIKQGVNPKTDRMKQAAASIAGRRAVTAKHGGVSGPMAILAIVRELQNGSGEGVDIKLIKERMAKLGRDNKSTSPNIADLMERGALVRTSKAHYRATDVAAAAEG